MLLIQLASCLMMTGLIWFVQVVHYPLFSAVGDTAFCSYEEAHCRLTTWVVAPLMLMELLSAAYLTWTFAPVPFELYWANLLLVGVWVSTAVIQVPLHNRLEQRFNTADHRLLVRSNWLRTFAWSARSLLLLSFL